MQYANLATIPLMFVGSWGIYEAASMAINLALPITFMKFSRNFEREADYLGLQYMYKAGYDPQAFVSFFEKIEAKDKQKPGILGEGVCFASADPGPDRKGPGRDQARFCRAEPQYVVEYVGVRLDQGAAGVAAKPQEGGAERTIPTSQRCGGPRRITIRTGRRSSQPMTVRRFRGATIDSDSVKKCKPAAEAAGIFPLKDYTITEKTGL